MESSSPNTKSPRTVRQRLAWTIVVIAMVPIVLVSLSFIYITRADRLQTTNDALTAIAGRQADLVGQTLNNQIDLLEALSENETVAAAISAQNASHSGTLEDIQAELEAVDANWAGLGDDDPFRRQRLVGETVIVLNEFRLATRDYASLIATDQYGGLVSATTPTQRFYYGDQAWWLEAFNNGAGSIYLSPTVVVDENTQTEGILIAVPYINEQGRFAGIIGAVYQLNTFDRSFNDNVFGQSGRVLIVDETGQVIFDPLNESQLANGSITGLGDESFVALSQAEVVPRVETPSGEEIVAATEAITSPRVVFAIDGLGWRTVAIQPAREAFMALNQALTLLIGLSAATLLVSLIVAFAISRSISKPLTNLTETARKFAQQDGFKARAEVSTRDEFGQLANTFNTMAGEIESLIVTLEERVEERTEDLQERITELTTLQRTGVKLAQHITTPEYAIRSVVDGITEVFAPDVAGVFLWDNNQDALVLRHMVSSNGQQADNDIASSTGTNAIAFHEKRTVVVADYPNWPGHNQDWAARFGIQNFIATPLIWQDGAIGTLFLSTSEATRQFDDNIQRLLVLFAQQAAATVQNAVLLARAEKAQAEAEEANKVKSQFLANMSHELRTPLNAILNFTGFVSKGVLGPVNDQQVDVLEKSVSSAKHLLSLINDMLDLTKIEVGMMELFIEDVDLNAVTSSVVAVTHGLLKDKPIELVTEIEELPTISGDNRRIRQILLNLVANAVKFTPEGTITIVAKQQGDAVYMAVKDTGIGIAEDEKDKVFERFQQAKHDLPEVTGTGLGMPITRYFIEAHGGRIWFDSIKGQGTTFHVELPLQLPVGTL